jgi:hypothetical protein
MKYTIYGQSNDDPTIYTIAQVQGKYAAQVIDMLFDYQEWTDYEIFFDTIWADGGTDE